MRALAYTCTQWRASVRGGGGGCVALLNPAHRTRARYDRYERQRHVRQTAVVRMTLRATERLVRHCGEPTAKPESASRGRSLVTKIR